jgi:uncharacterized protein with HEPN domain
MLGRLRIAGGLEANNWIRNISTHEYFNVSFHILCDITKNDLPLLKQQFIIILAELDQ